VPFASPPSLRAAMHTIFCVAQGFLVVPCFVPCRGSDESSDEGRGRRPGEGRRRALVAPLRLVVEKPLPEVPRVEEVAGWSYDVPQAEQAVRVRRRSLGWRNTVCGKAAVATMVDMVKGGVPFGRLPAMELRVTGKEQVELPLSRTVDVGSPGGSVVLTLSKAVYVNMMEGRSMSQGFFCELLGVLKGRVSQFVMSEFFDNWSPAWMALLRTCNVQACVSYARDEGHQALLVKLLAYMYDRFRAEALGVCQASNLYREKVVTVFAGAKVSLSKVARYMRKGRLPVAQSDQFVQRLLEIKECYDSALMVLESVGLFAPALVTSAQRRLPLRDERRRVPVVGARVVPGGLSGLASSVFF